MKQAKKTVVCVRMNRKALSLLLWIILLFSLCACSNPSGQKGDQLSKPQNLQIVNRVISWDADENAAGYLVRVGAEEYEISENSFSLHALTLEGGNCTVEVRSLGDGVEYTDSDWAITSKTFAAPRKSGTDKKGFSYVFLQEMQGYEVSAKDVGLTGTVVIPDYFDEYPVKRIADSAFVKQTGTNMGGLVVNPETPDIFSEKNCNTQTTKIVLPAYLESIGKRAFSYMVALREIVIPDSVTEIGENAFYGDKQLNKVTLPANLKIIPKGCFANTGLSEIVLPEGLEEIGASAFENVYKQSDGAFVTTQHVKSDLKTVTIPATVKVIGKNAFSGRENLKTVFLPSSLQSMGGYPFDKANALTYIFYAGTRAELEAMLEDAIKENTMQKFDAAPIYYYAEAAPTEEGNFWHYVDGKPTPWKTEE